MCRKLLAIALLCYPFVALAGPKTPRRKPAKPAPAEAKAAEAKPAVPPGMSVDECIAAIQRVADLGVGVGEVVEVRFTGSAWVVVENKANLDSLSSTVDSVLPWADYREVATVEKKDRTTVLIQFDSKFSDVSSYTNLKDATTDPPTEEAEDTLFLSIPISQAAQVDKLREAAERLHVLAKAGLYTPPPVPAEPSSVIAKLKRDLAARGPSEKETLKYINSRGKVCSEGHATGIAANDDMLIIPYKANADDENDIYEYYGVPWKTITHVYVRPGRNENFAFILVDGKASVFKLAYEETDYTFAGSYFDKLDVTKPQAKGFPPDGCEPFEVEKLANAIQHMADLKGATLDKDAF